MEFGNYLILIVAALILLSILAGLVSSRIGAPLLLVFLALGMLAGEDGPGGLDFDDFEAAYTIGALSLSIVLFDGGLRTSLDTIRTALWPAIALATVGVAVTALATGAAAHFVLGLGAVESLLVGSIVASTDAAAVFFLLGVQSTNLVRRVRATLEAESGLNDPMAVFLTVACVGFLVAAPADFDGTVSLILLSAFALQIAGGFVVGLVGGYALVALINRLKLAPGLYPILALAGALLAFGGAQVIGASGFLAVYVCGLVVGNRRHRARQLIERFQDGIAWLSQIVMFVMLGLLVTPSGLIGSLVPAIAIAVVLILVARPLAVVLCLAPFRFRWREQAFLSWVGLRGAVPIFLGTIPVIADLPNARLYFDVAFVVVLTSLLLQGWTIRLAARLLSLALPLSAGPPRRLDIDLPEDVGRDMSFFSVQDGSAALPLRPSDLVQARGTEVVAVVRDGIVHAPDLIARFATGDQVLILAPEAALGDLDRLFGTTPPEDRRGHTATVLGEFTFASSANIGELGRVYDFPVPASDRSLTVAEFLRRHLPKRPDVGDRLRLGPVELIVGAMDGDAIASVGIELDPEGASPLSRDNIRIWSRHVMHRLRGLMRFRRGGGA